MVLVGKVLASSCTQLVVDLQQEWTRMAQAMLNTFFDERYLSDDCLCEADKGPAGQSELCELHNSKSSSEKEENNIITINQAFPRQPTSTSLLESLEYRIKVQCLSTETFEPGQTRRILTNVDIGKKPGKLSLLLKSADLSGFIFQSEGYINPTWKGRISVCLQNCHCSSALIISGSVVAYLILSQFVQ